MVSIEESYKLFSDTLSYLNKERLAGSDEYLSYFIFEELSVDAVSFLHELLILGKSKYVTCLLNSIFKSKL